MGMALDEPHGKEQSIKVNGIEVLIEDVIKNYVDGTVIDYVADPSGEGFVITGAGSSC